MPTNLPLPAAQELADLLFSGFAERPIWGRFRTRLAELTGASLTVMVIDGIGSGAGPTVIGGEEHDAARIDLDRLRQMADHAAEALDGPASGARITALRVPLPPAGSAWLLLIGPADQAGWDEAGALGMLRQLAGDLAKAMPLYRLIAEAERARMVAEYVLESSGIGVVLVEGDCTVLSVNATARTIMDHTGLLAMRGGRLCAAAQADNTALRGAAEAMAQAQGPRLDPACYASVALADVASGQRLTLLVRPGPPYGPVSAPMRRTAAVIVRDPAMPATLPPADLVSLFALTPAEARLATRLADGEGLDEAAAALGVTRNTARSQLQAIFAKTGVNRQGDLVRVLLGSAASNVRGPGTTI